MRLSFWRINPDPMSPAMRQFGAKLWRINMLNMSMGRSSLARVLKCNYFILESFVKTNRLSSTIFRNPLLLLNCCLLKQSEPVLTAILNTLNLGQSVNPATLNIRSQKCWTHYSSMRPKSHIALCQPFSTMTAPKTAHHPPRPFAYARRLTIRLRCR